MGEITELVKEAHKVAVAHGQWENPPEFETSIGFCQLKLAEALAEYTCGSEPEIVYYDDMMEKETGVPVKLADAIIKIFDICGYYEIDIEKVILDKMLRDGGTV